MLNSFDGPLKKVEIPSKMQESMSVNLFETHLGKHWTIIIDGM